MEEDQLHLWKQALLGALHLCVGLPNRLCLLYGAEGIWNYCPSKKKKKKVHQCYVTSSSKNYKSKTFVQVAAILNWWCFVLFKQSWSDHASELFPFFFFLPGVDHIVLHSLSFLLCLVAHINSTACYNKCNLVTKKPDFISAYTRWWLFCHRRIVLS